jgi:hypothetical protein
MVRRVRANVPTVKNIGEMLMRKGLGTFPRRCGVDQLIVQFLPSLHLLSRAEVTFAFYAAYVCARVISRDGRKLCQDVMVEIWWFDISPSEENDCLIDCVKHILNSWNMVRSYATHRAASTPVDDPIEMWKYSVPATVLSTRLHDVSKDVTYDPRYRQFLRTWRSCRNDEGKARALAIWVVTRSIDLLELLEEPRGCLSNSEFLNHALFGMTMTRKRKDGLIKESCVLWKTKMPKESRDIGLNRVSSNPSSDNYVLRHVPVLLSRMFHKEFGTVNEAAHALQACKETGHFLRQHFIWNLVLMGVTKIRSIAPETMGHAISQRNSSAALLRVAADFRDAVPTPMLDKSQDDNGYYKIDVKETLPDKVPELFAELLSMVNYRKGNNWKIVMHIHSKNKDHQMDEIVLEDNLLWDEQFTSPFNTLCNLCMAEKVWKQCV